MEKKKAAEESCSKNFTFVCASDELARHNLEILKKFGIEASLVSSNCIQITQEVSQPSDHFYGDFYFSDREGTRLADLGEKCRLVKSYNILNPLPTDFLMNPGSEPVLGFCDELGIVWLSYDSPPAEIYIRSQAEIGSRPTPYQEIGGPIVDLDLIVSAMDGDRGVDQQRIAEEGAAWVALLLRKNSDYGSAAWKNPVLAPECNSDSAMRVRMSDKIERIQSLLSKGEAEVSESLEDTVRDLGSYCLLWLTRPK